MTTPKIIVVAIWLAFWAYWGLSASRSKRGTRSSQGMPLRVLLAVAVILLLSGVHAGSLRTHGTVLPVIGIVVLLCGFGFAVWARVHIVGDGRGTKPRRRLPERLPGHRKPLRSY
jgi:CHASE2 domain-containing sensor protein